MSVIDRALHEAGSQTQEAPAMPVSDALAAILGRGDGTQDRRSARHHEPRVTGIAATGARKIS